MEHINIKENLIEEITLLAKKLGRTPKKREFANNPSAIYYFKTWNNFIKAANLTPLKAFDLTINDYQNYIKDFAKENGRLPTKKDFDDNIYLPDTRTIERKLGMPWSQILINLGYEPNIRIRNDEFLNYSDKQLLDAFKEELLRLNTNICREYDERRSDKAPSFILLKNRFNKTWNEILKDINIDINNQRRTKEQWLEILIDISDKIGRPPSISDIETFGFNPTTYKLNFGTYNQALKEAGLVPKKTPVKVKETDRELIDMYISFSKRIGKSIYGASSIDLNNDDTIYSNDVFDIRFNGLNNLRALAGFEIIKAQNKKYSKEQILRILSEQYQINNRKLTNKEINYLSKSNLNFPSVSSICRYFQTTKMSEIWDIVLKDVDIHYNEKFPKK